MIAAAKSPKESWVEMTEIILPQHTNSFGTAFGGVIMSWVDIAAATAALRHTGRPVVTAAIDAMHFLAPVKLGWIVTLRAAVNYTARTSMEIGVKVSAENPITQEKYHTATAYVTFVALDDQGKPTEVPKVIPETEKEKERFANAELRRRARLEWKAKLTAREKARQEK